MEALTSFSTKIFASNGNRSPPLSALTQQGRSVLAFSPSPAFKKLHFDRLVSFRSIAKSHVASDAAQVTFLIIAQTGFFFVNDNTYGSCSSLNYVVSGKENQRETTLALGSKIKLIYSWMNQ